MTHRRLGAPLALVLAVAGLLPLAGCGPEETITVLAGSEIRDIEPILADLEEATGVRIQPTYIGTLEGAERIAAGDETDAAWFSHAKYLALLPETSRRIVTSESTMLSPVIIGVKQSVAERFGWVDNPEVTWEDIAERSGDGELRFAMTNPAASNSGFTALVGVASALSGSSDAIDAGEVDTQALARFFRGQSLTAGSSGFLAEDYVRSQDSLDAMVNYESVLMSLNAGGELAEPLTLVYPREGIITADYPFMLLNDGKRAAWQEAVDWLRTPEIQARIMNETLRRPAVPGVQLADAFPDESLLELPFPSRLETIDELLVTYLDTTRRPASAIFVIDVSGSMEGDRIENLRTALNGLTGTDVSVTGRFARFRAREDITIVTFSSGVQDERQFTIDDTDQDGPDMSAIREHVDGLVADGGTAIYDALWHAYQLAERQVNDDPDRLRSIVLMTDGENNEGSGLDQFRGAFATLSDEARAVHTYTVLFGEANTGEMEEVAELTGGRTFDAHSESLATVFKQIRGYQ